MKIAEIRLGLHRLLFGSHPKVRRVTVEAWRAVPRHVWAEGWQRARVKAKASEVLQKLVQILVELSEVRVAFRQHASQNYSLRDSIDSIHLIDFLTISK